MISAILWKEYREQRIVWAALAFVGAALLLGLPVVMAPGGMDGQPKVLEALQVAAIVLAWVYAVVCGAMLLAGEREASTLPFLDALPGWRGRLWCAKCLAGGLLALTQVVVLIAAAWAARLLPTLADAAWMLSWMTTAAVYGLGWGLFFSAIGRNAMNMILVSLPVQLGALGLAFCSGAVVGMTVALVVGATPVNLEEERNAFLAGGMVGVGLLIGLSALTGSALIFTALDRGRGRPLAARAPGSARSGFVLTASLWLAWRQARGFAVGLAVFALLLGLMVLLQGVVIWPMATLLVGVLCGVTAFAGEQEGPFRFLGDQRLPLGRLWLVKVGLRFAVAVGAALIVLAPSFFVALANSPAFTQHQPGERYSFFAHVFNSNLIGGLCPAGLFLTVWLISGFSTGCLYGILFRNGLASGIFGLFTGVLLACIWVPSMLCGGLHLWQALGPPVLLLLATRLILRPWAAGRIASWTTALRLAPFVVLAALWIAGGLWYRVMEIPYVPENTDLAAFRASLPTPEQNEGGELKRRACLRFADLRRALDAEQPARQRLPDGKPPALSPEDRAGDALENGWNANDAELASYLDKLFAGEWVGMLKKAADLPPGMFDDLRNVTEMSPLSVQPAREIAVVLVARGLQRQAAGDDEAYVENLRIGLSLSETLRHRAPFIDVLVGRAVEGALIGGLDRWLERLKGQPDLLQKALVLLSHTANETEGADQEQELAEDLIIKNTVDDTLPWLEQILSDNEGQRASARARGEAQWVATAWIVPWEGERQARILRTVFWGDNAQQRTMVMRPDLFGPLSQFTGYRQQWRMQPILQCRERAVLLKLALRWYQADKGKPADKLEELVPNYLPSIPDDPFDGQPFRYRLSKGEEIEWPEEPAAMGAAPPPAAPAQAGPPMMGAPGMAPPMLPPHTRKIPLGQGILWCVGEDKHDDGGHRQTASPLGQTNPGEDVIFLVPPPPGDK